MTEHSNDPRGPIRHPDRSDLLDHGHHVEVFGRWRERGLGYHDFFALSRHRVEYELAVHDMELDIHVRPGHALCGLGPRYLIPVETDQPWPAALRRPRCCDETTHFGTRPSVEDERVASVDRLGGQRCGPVHANDVDAVGDLPRFGHDGLGGSETDYDEQLERAALVLELEPAHRADVAAAGVIEAVALGQRVGRSLRPEDGRPGGAHRPLEALTQRHERSVGREIADGLPRERIAEVVVGTQRERGY